MADTEYLGALRRLAARAPFVTSVRTGSLLLGAAGLLEGRRAACHWAFRELVRHFGALPDGRRVVRDGNVFTGGGVTAGIDRARPEVLALARARFDLVWPERLAAAERAARALGRHFAHAGGSDRLSGP